MANTRSPKDGLLARVAHFLRRENLHRILIVLFLLSLASAVGLWWLEPRAPFTDWLWWSIVTLTTVGYGDIAPTTFGGRVIGVVLMFFGIGVLGMFTATVASFFVERNLRRERGMGNCDLRDHIILCGWNDRAREILRELRSDRRHAATALVLLAELEAKPIDDEHLVFIHGAVNDENLDRANLTDATTVILLGDDRLDPGVRDAQVVLAALAVECKRPEVYTIAELAKEENLRHCQRARVDEIIVGDEVSSRLIATAAVDHGLSKVITELLSLSQGSTLERRSLPDGLAGRGFCEVLSEMKQTNNVLVLAVQRGVEVMTNPRADLVVEASDQLIVVGEA